jgi:hypothetical protein
MSRQQNDHGAENWFQERDEARAASGAAPEGMAPEANGQEGALGDDANPQEPAGQNTGNRGIGQYSGQGAPPRMKK